MKADYIQDQYVLASRENDTAMNQFIEENRTFILQCASKTCRRFISQSDDEYEISLIAFWEALRTYNEQAGHFAGFAALVIRRRLMDYFDTQSRYRREISAGHSMTWDHEDAQENTVIAEVQKVIVREAADNPVAVKEEIEALGTVLKEYGFSFFDLAEASPKAEKTRHCCAMAVNWMLDVAERILRMRKSHALPTAAISKSLEIARKILERHRRYIIAATEILDGDYPHLTEYMDYIRKERSV